MIYIQSNLSKTRAHNFAAACAQFGAIASGTDYKYVTQTEVADGKYDLLIKRNLFVGSTDFMRLVFSRINLQLKPLPLNEIMEYESTTLGEALSRVNSGENLFVKPYEVKLFSGFVPTPNSAYSLRSIPLDTPVWVCSAFRAPLIAEWRVYVVQGKIKYVGQYFGEYVGYNWDYFLSPLFERKDLPSAFVVDVGLINDGRVSEPVLIEFGDMVAIDNYGWDNEEYLNALKLRYKEIMDDNR